MRTETGTADTTRPAAADMTEAPKATERLYRRKKSKWAVGNGNKVIRSKKTAGNDRKKALPKAPPKTIRTDFDLSLATFAKMTGVTQNALAKWEKDKSVRLDVEAIGRVARVARILEGLARVMRRPFIPAWIARPNDACKEIGASTPLDLFERADYETLEEIVWYLESGTPN